MRGPAVRDGRTGGEVLSGDGEGCGVRNRGPSDGCGCMIVRASLDFREWFESDPMSEVEIGATVRAARESALRGIGGASSGGV